ncbi:MAG: hypothetical protein AABZ30_12190 [Myxococcota bacterium]
MRLPLIKRSALVVGAALSLGADPNASITAEAPEEDRLSTGFELSNSLGLGTFVENDYSDAPFFGQALDINPTYKLTDDISADVDWILAWEYTTPDNPTGRRYTPSDVVFRVAHSSLLKDARFTGLTVTSSVLAIAPTSYESRFRGTVTNLTGRIGVNRPFLGDRLTPSYRFSATKYLPTQQSPGFLTDPEEQEEIADDQGHLLVACSVARDACAGTAGINPSYSFTNRARVDYKVTSKFSAKLILDVTNIFKFETPEAFSDPNLPSRGRVDMTAGVFELVYSLHERLDLKAGVTSEQPALDSRNDGLRFPFFDFESPSNNFTQFYLSVATKL